MKDDIISKPISEDQMKARRIAPYRWQSHDSNGPIIGTLGETEEESLKWAYRVKGLVPSL